MRVIDFFIENIKTNVMNANENERIVKVKIKMMKFSRNGVSEHIETSTTYKKLHHLLSVYCNTK